MRRSSVFFSAAAVAALLAGGSASAQLQTWNIDPAHTSTQFAVRHMGISTVRGAFTKVSGTVDYDPADLKKTAIEATIDAASVDTRVERRDNDLRSPNFFDVAKYPTLTFKSKSVEPAGSGKMKVSGDLTIHGVTKPVVLDVDGPTEPMKDPHGNLHMGASGTTTVNRKDFGVSGLPGIVGDEVSITLDIEVVHKTSSPPTDAPSNK
ncbi:MAG TPA: YceI family protein [Acidobacteriaceae bacterium]|jgi:polyisoprenoid-binding protein YceI